jgi:hypothetical protein
MGIFRPNRPVNADSDESLEALGFHEEDEGTEDDELSLAADLILGQAKDSDKDEDSDEEDSEDEEESDEEESDDEEIEIDTEENSDSVVLSKNKIVLAKKLLENIRDNNEKLIALLGGLLSEEDENRISIAEISDGFVNNPEGSDNVIEGVFDGQNMIGPDGKEYSVPANYASKSKLVEGDMLKLTITDRGTFVYKQTKPVERRRVMARLEKDEEGNYFAIGDNKKWRVITASITYFKGAPGDKAVILVSKSGDSQWAAVENVIRGK